MSFMALNELTVVSQCRSSRSNVPRRERARWIAVQEQTRGRRMSRRTIDLDGLPNVHRVVAGSGQLDIARWWNTEGHLGWSGALHCDLPQAHRFAQACAGFAVAAHRCAEVFKSPRCMMVLRVPEPIEKEIDARWDYWLDH